MQNTLLLLTISTSFTNLKDIFFKKRLYYIYKQISCKILGIPLIKNFNNYVHTYGELTSHHIVKML